MLTSVTQCKSSQQVDDKMRLDKHAMSLSLITPCVVDNLSCKSGNESECSMYQMRFQCAVNKGKNKYKGFGYNIVISIILIIEERLKKIMSPLHRRDRIVSFSLSCQSWTIALFHRFHCNILWSKKSRRII